MALSFDSVYYFNQRPDVLAAWQASDLSLSPYEFAVAHYDAFGWREGANPNKMFNTDEYLDAWPDLVVAGVNPFNHFNEFGFSEGRAPNASTPGLNDFDWELYLSKNSDLTDAGITTKEAAYDHYLNFGYAENRPGTPDDGDVQLTQALENLADAQGDLDEFVDAAALELHVPPTLTDVETALEANLAGANTAMNAHAAITNIVDWEAASDAARAEGIAAARASLTKDINDYNKDIADAEIPGLAAAIKAYNAADKADIAAQAALGTAGTKAESDLAALKVLGGAVNTDPAGINLATDPDQIAAIDNIIDGPDVLITKNAAGKFVLGAGITEAGHEGVTALLNSMNAALAANTIAVQTDIAKTEADTYLATFDSAVNGSDLNPGPGAMAAIDVADAVAAKAKALSDFNSDVANFDTAEDLVNELQNLVDARDGAVEVIEDMGYEAPVFVEGAAYDASAGDSIFMYADDGGSIFGFEASDILYFSAGYDFTLVALDAGDDIMSGGFGSVSALEIFIQQVGLDTKLYIEEHSYDGTAGAGAHEITLVGVDASSITLQDGFLRVSDMVA